MWTNKLSIHYTCFYLSLYLLHVHVSIPRANLQEEINNQYSTVQYMSTCMVNPGTSKCGFAGVTIIGFISRYKIF